MKMMLDIRLMNNIFLHKLIRVPLFQYVHVCFEDHPQLIFLLFHRVAAKHSSLWPKFHNFVQKLQGPTSIYESRVGFENFLLCVCIKVNTTYFDDVTAAPFMVFFCIERKRVS